MSGLRDSLGRVGFDLLSTALSDGLRARATGGLRVTGRPGGVFHLRDGRVVAVRSPGAPGPEARLLRSGRIGGEQWADLVREADGARWPSSALIAHGVAGAAQLRVVCVMAMQDAAFAVVAGDVERCDRPDPAVEADAPVEEGEYPGRLLQEAARKLAALAALPRPVRPDRERPVTGSVPDAVRERLTPQQREVLAHADGRRTARDIAFVTGLGVYTVTVGVARLLGEGLLDLPGESAYPIPVTVRIPPAQSLGRRPPASAAHPAPEPPCAPPAEPDDGAGAARTGPDGAAAGSPNGSDVPDGTGAGSGSPPGRPEGAGPVSADGPGDTAASDSAGPGGTGRGGAGEPEPGDAGPRGAAAADGAARHPDCGHPGPSRGAPGPRGAGAGDAGPGPGVRTPPGPRTSPDRPAAASPETAHPGGTEPARTAPGSAGPGPADRPDVPVIPEPGAPALPRREPGASGITGTAAPEPAAASWKGFFRLRHRIWTPDSGA
ncbi:hypothetical protein ACGFS9_25970 [Streptomyces sp. NPDC048566]|uniref:hypothetical protein n=1 Tax=Streptomyces sp. NPDC048566 TaxID=3365569 RepID=UPI0037134261